LAGCGGLPLEAGSQVEVPPADGVERDGGSHGQPLVSRVLPGNCRISALRVCRGPSEIDAAEHCVLPTNDSDELTCRLRIEAGTRTPEDQESSDEHE
jgi:hypothetical protein